ncbi:probable sodium/potassium/calcium exchanger CG1090 isoform X1 [Dermacentor albipictus]|uniref:probable sodium/potassium/calcium exchanger CG1090 isoform X1 n=1 Tax=Dermacentor albipictus TaxID=60249 RepID=UPI0031FE012A
MVGRLFPALVCAAAAAAAAPNCTVAAIEQFPRPLMSPEFRKQGGIVVHVLAALYMFAALSIICEDYFVPSLEVICDVLHVDPDVAGATFMAAASSVPAIAASIIAIMVAKGEMGVSTALGSAVLNAAGVISVSALFAGKVVVLHRWPMYRDSVFFFASVVVLLVALQDEAISRVESILLLAAYVVYAVFMCFDSKAEAFFLRHLAFLHDEPPTSSPAEPTPVPVRRRASRGLVLSSGASAAPRARSLDAQQSARPPPPPPRRSLALDPNRRRLSLISLRSRSGNYDQREAESKSVPDAQGDHVAALEEMARRANAPASLALAPPRGCFPRLLWLVLLPLNTLLFFTVPDCKRDRWRNWFPLTFLMSTVYISVFSYLLVWIITIIGFTLDISDTVMGLTFLSIGVTLPDVVASLLVVRRGFGDMAVCNALGSNIFEILVGLGLPWFIKTVLLTPGTPAVVHGKGLAYSTACLLSTVVFLLLLTHLNKWRMNKTYGAILMGWYLTFMVVACLHELNVFGYINPPSCNSDY